MSETIYIQDFLPSIIASRKAIQFFEEDMQLSQNSAYTFDFTNIIFISRAFADELVKFLKNNNIHFELKNANANIQEMLNVVQKNRSKRKGSYHNIAVTTFHNENELHQFLSLI